MIIHRKTKGFQIRSDKPNENWTDEDCFIVEDGSTLANKIIENYPYYDFILDDNGELISIEPTERPQPQDPQPSEEEKKIQELEQAIAELTILVAMGGM